MVNLNLKIWNVTEENNGILLWGPDRDLSNAIGKISSAAASVLTPVNIAVENTIDTIRHPINNIVNYKAKNGSYKKLLKFVPSTIALAITKAIDLPFATAEKAVEYVLNNNVERGLEFTKWISTKFLANIITSNWETNSGTAKLLWSFIEWTWDLVTSAVKLPLWLTHKAIKAPRNIKWYGTQVAADWSTKNMESLQISDKSYLEWIKLINTSDKTKMVASNNTDYRPSKEKAA